MVWWKRVKTAEIAPEVAGLVQQIMVQAGDPIKQGQVLARIDARAVQQELAASRANIEAVKAESSVGRKDYERQKALFGNGSCCCGLKSTTAQAQATNRAGFGSANSVKFLYFERAV